MKFLLALLISSFSLLAATPNQYGPFMSDYTWTDWAQRVVNNSGPPPSRNTIQCMESLRTSMIALGTNGIYSLCVFVPDSVIAASTPLFKHKGSDPWTNFNFAATNLTIEGLKGDGTSKAFDIGIQAANNHAYSNNMVGITMIVTESNSNRTEVEIGATDAPGTGSQLVLAPGNQGGRMEFYSGSLASGFGFLITNDFVRVGYISANTVTNAGVTNQNIYIASQLESHRLFASEPMSPAAAGVPGLGITLSAFARKQDGTNNQFSGQRMSAMLVHFPFTETQSSNVWWALKTCRECLGGGVGNPVQDYARRLVELGGPTLSTTSSNAATTYYSQMGTFNLIKDFKVANTYFPDNLFATRTPLIWQAGLQVWSNAFFGETNLTVNGLKGNTTDKHLGTAIRPFTLNPPFTDASAGLSVLTSEGTSTGANMFEYGTTGGAANTLFTLHSFNSNLVYYCWLQVNVNADFVSAPSPTGTNWSGFLTGNRTAANAIRLEYYTNGVFVSVTNATGAQAGNNDTFTNSIAHGRLNSASVPSGFSDRRVSYFAIHSGLDATASSNHAWVVANLRTNLGGGFPP